MQEKYKSNEGKKQTCCGGLSEIRQHHFSMSMLACWQALKEMSHVINRYPAPGDSAGDSTPSTRPPHPPLSSPAAAGGDCRRSGRSHAGAPSAGVDGGGGDTGSGSPGEGSGLSPAGSATSEPVSGPRLPLAATRLTLDLQRAWDSGGRRGRRTYDHRRGDGIRALGWRAGRADMACCGSDDVALAAPT
jgi:hypothetical protein